jgi:hypothetical protein
MPDDRTDLPPDVTIPSRATLPNLPGSVPVRAPARRPETGGREAPPFLRQALSGEIDLEAELSVRYPQMPVMATLHTRRTAGHSPRGIATISTQDGAASLVFEVEAAARHMACAFIIGSMIGQRFTFPALSDSDRGYWRDGLMHSLGETVYLWGAARWESDYLVCIPHRHYTSVFAFAPHHAEAAARLTREVTVRLTEWLATAW